MNDEIDKAKVRLYVALISVPPEQLTHNEAELLLVLAKDPVIKNRLKISA